MNWNLNHEQKLKFEEEERKRLHPNFGPFKVGESQGSNQMLINSQKAQEAMEKLPISDSERAKVYKDTLSYVLDNLVYRATRLDSCATDEQLIKYIKYPLSDEGLKECVEIYRFSHLK